jgi:hypothetical protein
MRRYLRNGKECVLCESRKKLILLTPEELVRQDFIRKLVADFMVPLEAVESEVPLSYYQPGAKGRVDILVSAISESQDISYPLIIVECKAPGVFLTDKVFNQIDRYADFIGALFLVITNGRDTLYYGWNDDIANYQEIAFLPTFQDLLKIEQLNFVEEAQSKWVRPNHRQEGNKIREELLGYGQLGEDTNPELLSVISNLFDQTEIAITLPLITKKFISDNGLRFTTFGNAAGGGFTGEYRFFLVENNLGETEIVSLSIMGSLSTKNDPKWGNRKGYTVFGIAIDDFENSHLSLEYSIDRFIEKNGDRYIFWHDGTLTVGKKGRAKNREVIDFIAASAPHLVQDQRIILGAISNIEQLSWDKDEVRQLIANFIDYGFLRDDFRNTKK